MPLTCSSMIEGGRMEEIQREDERIAIHDFQDRQPSRSGDKPLQRLSALGNRKVRFREANGLASWDHREGTKRITKMIRSHLSKEQRKQNSTRGFDGLTKEEFRAIRDENRRSGHFNTRGRKKMAANKTESATTGDSRKTEEGSRKRKRKGDEASQDDGFGEDEEDDEADKKEG